MRSESSEEMWKTTGAFINSWRIKITLESYLKKHAHEVWERNRMFPDMHTTLLDIDNLKLMETFLKVLREQFEDDDQMKTAGELAGLVPET